MELDIKKAQREIERLASQYRLDLVVLFGSYAKGKTHSLSDVDIAFYSQSRMRPIEIAKMQLDFCLALKIRDIELTDLKDAPPLLLRQIAEHSVLLYEKGYSSYARFKIYAYKRYMEAGPILKIRQAQLNNFLKLHAR